MLFRSSDDFHFRNAQPEDASTVLALMNASYREQHPQSWTTEAHLVTGARLNTAQYEAILANPEVQLLLATDCNHATILACIGITFYSQYAEIGSFAVQQHLQNRGLGKQLLHVAEQFCLKHRPNIKYFEMYVLELRQELIAFYQRRGYVLCDEFLAYPITDDVGEPLQSLRLQRMLKQLPVSALL